MSRYLALIIILLPMAVQAQITAPGSRTVRPTNYPATPRTDSVYIFCATGPGDTGTLTASSPGGTAPFTFTWTRYNQSGGGYTIPVKTESGITSTATGLAEGGYRVQITGDGGYSNEFYAWVNLSMPVAGAALQHYTCDYVALDGTKAADPFTYYDPLTNVSRLLPNGVKHLWSSSPASAIPYPDIEIDPITFSPPLTDVRYTLQVTDSFGCSTSASFDYTSIHVKAEFTADPVEGESPLEITFTDKSVRASKYLWKFGDDSVSTMQDPGTHTYYIPGEYTVSLVIESELTCRDSATAKIEVLPSALQIPNVFTPNDDGLNDYFVPDKKSIRFLNLQIFAKSGHRVYYYQGDGEDLQNWLGWDGRINYSERRAEPGAYYYVLRAEGYDDVEYKGREFRGTVYLYR
ncbi:MAG: gliding motility-associated C-terminal domain-containing protein [Bacteroidales bacterium]|nr:gliding motility-associated C-terminal domain-containing protein [Bacteroidales bacterium]MDX9926345.1 gliding motility-associated C-terminal domain-containing protein [Bacteroidales bacterium]HNX84352.1 gliding motility-associated C-terminal domain-containing protein [Bacteroidales bacterium]HOC48840.1 gliding motility-associated C-terminal domain-containing protein [Bacteroidales bacterium]HPS97937.1 gliding motility-associated C-terminal domain-containing protein [Bacteroidales bacterium]